jgi:hypothetical protein
MEINRLNLIQLAPFETALAWPLLGARLLFNTNRANAALALI